MCYLSTSINPTLKSQKTWLLTISKTHTWVNRLYRLLELNDLRNHKALVLRTFSLIKLDKRQERISRIQHKVVVELEFQSWLDSTYCIDMDERVWL